MADMMPADQAAKVLLKYRATGRITERLVPAIDAAVAALEVDAVPVLYVAFSDDGTNIRWWSRTPPPVECSVKNPEHFYAATQPAYCCAKCGLADLHTTHPRERALHQDAKRGNFRHTKNNDGETDGA